MGNRVAVKEPYPPGDFAIWLVIYVELVTFGLMFIGYSVVRHSNVELFNKSQLLLNQTSGFIDTLILITGSYFIVKAVNLVKNAKGEEIIKEANQKASKWIAASVLFGCMFLVNKLLEFSDIFSQGISLDTNKFFMFYLLLTMFHFMHVTLGTIILFNIFRRTKVAAYSAENTRGIETGAVYWHLVDVLWIVLFPLIYIIR
ncbi:Nitric oxide reductase activation protein NorE [hydrothermal vent metagenome]|uniref:Nitric oxide reductase activation protein NorE n=1 Tax=hydrothermal vent metagenome TaxID=652676 RepID=A0A1W1BLC1_9ZZZZ